MLRRYTNVSFINESATERGTQKGNRWDYVAWHPGDLVRPQLFADDIDGDKVPLGIVVFFCPNKFKGIGILWSSDPDAI